MSAEADRLSAGDRAALRAQALAWLREALADRRKEAANAGWAVKQQLVDDVPGWLTHHGLVGLRPGPGRVEMPPEEAAEWDALWGEVYEVIALARRPPDPPHIAPYPRAAKR